MSIVVNGTTIKKLIINGVDKKEGFAQGVKVFTSEFIAFDGDTAISVGGAKATIKGVSVDLTPYTKMFITYSASITSGKGHYWAGVFTGLKTNVGYAEANTAYLKGVTGASSVSTITSEIDITDINEERIVGLGIHAASSYSGSGHLYKIVLM